MMKKGVFLLSFFLLFTKADAQSMNVNAFYQLYRDGIPNPQLRFGTEDDCKAAISKIGLMGVYTCPFSAIVSARANGPGLSSVGNAVATPPVIVTPPVVTPTVALDSTTVLQTAAVLAKPAKGVKFTEPDFKLSMVRATNHNTDGVTGFAINDYSRRKAFNADNSYYLIYDTPGNWHLYNATTFQRLKTLNGLSGDAEPQWHPTDPNRLFFLPGNGIGMTIKEVDVSTNVVKTDVNLSSRLKALYPTAEIAWTKSEGAPSKDARYWCFMVEVNPNNPDTLGVVTYDMQTDTILGNFPINHNRPDSVSMSPSGKYCVISWANTSGTVAYSKDFSSSRKVHTWSEHSDLAIGEDGVDNYVTVDYGTGDLFTVNLDTGVRTNLLNQYPGNSAIHISGKAYNKPGWVLVSNYTTETPNQWFNNRIFALRLKLPLKIYNIGFTRNTYIPGEYYTEPHATVNLDFTKVQFTSNWNVNSASDLDAYQIEIPSGSIQ